MGHMHVLAAPDGRGGKADRRRKATQGAVIVQDDCPHLEHVTLHALYQALCA